MNTEEGVVPGGICSMTKNDRFLVEALAQLLVGKRSRAWGRKKREVRLGEIGAGVQRRADRHQLKLQMSRQACLYSSSLYRLKCTALVDGLC